MDTQLKLEYIKAIFSPNVDYRISLEKEDCPQYHILEALTQAGMITKMGYLGYKIPASKT